MRTLAHGNAIAAAPTPTCALLFLFFGGLAGCTTQVTYVRTREPLEKERIHGVEIVAVLPFKHTSGEPGAAGITESRVEAAIQGSFKVVDRKNVRQLGMERGFNESDMVDPRTRQEIRMTGADSVICGEVSKYESVKQSGCENVREVVPEYSYYTDNRGRRQRRMTYRVAIVPKEFLRVEVTASISMKLIRLADGSVLVSHAQTLTAKDQGGGTSSKSIASVKTGGEMLNDLSRRIVAGFLAKIIRTDVVEHRTLDKYWGDGVKAALNGDWDVASRYFWDRYLRDKDSAEALNNIAVCIEATAKNNPQKIRKAIALYRKAVELDYESTYSKNLSRAEAMLDEVLRHTEENK